MRIVSPLPLNGQVDTTRMPVDVVATTDFVVKSLLIQNTHATNNLTVFFLGKGESSFTVFSKSNMNLTVENNERLDIRKMYVQGSGPATTYELLALTGTPMGRRTGEPV